jgi:integrase
LRGLILRLTAKGAVSWSVRGRIRDGAHVGKQTRASLGTWPKVTLKAARVQARRLLGQIADGADPTAKRRAAEAARLARLNAPTVADRLADWQHAKAADWSERYAAEVKRLCDKIVLPELGKRVLAETTRSDWVDLIAAQRASRPSAATWLYASLSSFLSHAEAHGWIAIHPLPRRGLAAIAPKGPPRARILSDDELRRVWKASETLAPKARCFARLLVLCAVRVQEAAGIALGELHLAQRRWTIPAERAKNGQSITLPLCDLALAELQAVLPPAGAGPDYRLLGAIRGGGLKGISAVKRQLDRHSGVADWTMHDLRRTARSALARLGVSNDHAEAALNHVSHRSQLQRTYDRHDYVDEVLAALGTWQMHLAELIGGAPADAEVIELRRVG